MSSMVSKYQACIGIQLQATPATAPSYFTWAYANLVQGHYKEEANELLTWWSNHPANPLFSH